MKRIFATAFIFLLTPSIRAESDELRLIVLDPAHPHAAQIQAQPLAGFSNEVHVYAPLGTELTAYLNGIAQFNQRAKSPTQWSVSTYAGADFLERMLKEPPGNVVVLSGRNKEKMTDILASIRAGQHVLADKPWMIESRDLPKLEAALNAANDKHLIAYDCMTQRFDAAYQIQRALLQDSQVFGKPLPGTPDDPAVRMENLHALLKHSASGDLMRPAWFFDVRQQGEGIADVGTHLVDLVFWTLFPDQAIDYRRDIQVLRGEHSPTILTRSQYERVTRVKAWPDYLKDAVKDDRLAYYCNNKVAFTVRGVHTFVDVNWEYEAAPGANDSYLALYRGSRSTVRLREGKEENYRSEVDVIPNPNVNRSELMTALETKLKALSAQYPGLSLREMGDQIRIVIPDQVRRQGGDHFTALVHRFFNFVQGKEQVPAWEKANMIAKYYVTTKAVDLAREARR